MALINPFPDEAVRLFVAKAEGLQRYLLALVNAQRTVIMADDAVGGLVEEDRRLVDATLDGCWDAARRARDGGLREFVAPLFGRMVPDYDEGYSPYHSVVNDATASLVHAIESFGGDDAAVSAYHAASTMFDLADHLLHRHRTDYVNDLASEPITALAARCVVADVERLTGAAISPDLGELRLRAIDEGHRIAALADQA